MPASPFLSYSLLCSVGATNDPLNGITYVNVGQPATLTLVVSNPGDPVTLDSLTLAFSLGTDATDLTASDGDITAVLPAGWTSAWGPAGLTLTPPGGSLSIGTTTGLTFNFQISAVNSIVGTTQVGVTETTANQTAYVPPFSIPMVPAGFALTNLSASPPQIAPGGTVTLSWKGTPNQAYTVNYVGGPFAGVSVTAPSGGSVSWVSPAIETTETSAAFVVSAVVQSVTVEASTTVLVSAPQILSFPEPGVVSYGDALPLQWTTASATHCQLYLNGVLVDANAPANTPAGGYPITPTAAQNTCQLYACYGDIQSLPSQITLAAKLWTFGQTLSGLDPYAVNSLALSADGSTLYAGGTTNGGCLCAISTATMTVAVQAPNMSSSSIGTDALALSSDGTQLYVGSSGGILWTVMAYPLPSLVLPSGSPVVTIGLMVSFDEGTGMLFTAAGGAGSAGNQTALMALGLSSQTATAGLLSLSNLPTALRHSHDGTTLYVLFAVTSDVSPGSIAIVPVSSLIALSISDALNGIPPLTPATINGVSSMGLALPPAGAPNGNVLYAIAGGSASLVPIALPANTPGTAIPLFTPPAGASAQVMGIGSEPSGGIFAAVKVTGLASPVGPVDNGLNIFVVNPHTNGVGLVGCDPTNPGITTAAFVSDSTGGTLYCATSGTIIQLTQLTGNNAEVKRSPLPHPTFRRHERTATPSQL